MTFTCTNCGKEHDEWPPDRSFRLPDEIFRLSADQRTARASVSADFCTLDGSRHFIRTVLLLPLREHEEFWGIGLWVEVSEVNFHRYYALFDQDASDQPGFVGRIANAVEYFPDALGAEVQVILGPSSQRPTLRLSQPTLRISQAQSVGLTDAEIHAALERG